MTSPATAPMTPPDQSGPLSQKVLHSFAEAESYRTDWDDLALRAGADIYQTFDWCRLWWKFYGPGRQLHLVLVFQADRLVGVYPGFSETLWMGPCHLRVARMIGADFSLTLCHPPILPQNRREALTAVVRYFLGELRQDVLLVGPISGPHLDLEQLGAIGDSEPTIVAKSEVLGTYCNTYFHLPESFEAYLKSLESKRRGEFRRKYEQLGKARPVSVDTITDADAAVAEFEHFQKQHEAQWTADGKMGHFGDWPRALEFNREVVRALAPLGRIRFYRITAENTVLSSQYCFVFGQTNYWRLPARLRAADLEKLGMGSIGLVKMIEASIAAGLRTIEGGRGHYDYKVNYGGTELPLRTVQFVRRGGLARQRTAVFRLGALLLEKAYYRLIFIRLAPRFKFLQRPLWSYWIRTTW